MYQRDISGFAGSAGAIGRAARPRAIDRAMLRRSLDTARSMDVVVDLGQRIGSLEWWRGLVTLGALCAATVSLAPRLHPLIGTVPARMGEADAQEMRLSAIAPQAF